MTSGADVTVGPEQLDQKLARVAAPGVIRQVGQQRGRLLGPEARNLAARVFRPQPSQKLYPPPFVRSATSWGFIESKESPPTIPFQSRRFLLREKRSPPWEREAPAEPR